MIDIDGLKGSSGRAVGDVGDVGDAGADAAIEGSMPNEPVRAKVTAALAEIKPEEVLDVILLLFA